MCRNFSPTKLCETFRCCMCSWRLFWAEKKLASTVEVEKWGGEIFRSFFFSTAYGFTQSLQYIQGSFLKVGKLILDWSTWKESFDWRKVTVCWVDLKWLTFHSTELLHQSKSEIIARQLVAIFITSSNHYEFFSKRFSISAEVEHDACFLWIDGGNSTHKLLEFKCWKRDRKCKYIDFCKFLSVLEYKLTVILLYYRKRDPSWTSYLQRICLWR